MQLELEREKVDEDEENHDCYFLLLPSLLVRMEMVECHLKWMKKQHTFPQKVSMEPYSWKLNVVVDVVQQEKVMDDPNMP